MNPEYFYNRNQLQINKEGIHLQAKMRSVTRQVERLSESYVGATLAGLFFRYAWLGSFELVLEVSTGYEQGQPTRKISNSINNVRFVPGVPVVDDENGDAMDEDSGFVADVISQRLWDDEAELHAVLSGSENPMTRVVRTLSREAISTLIDEVNAGQSFAGSTAFALFFPEIALDPELEAPVFEDGLFSTTNGKGESDKPGFV
jgi:hypothetical protein